MKLTQDRDSFPAPWALHISANNSNFSILSKHPRDSACEKINPRARWVFCVYMDIFSFQQPDLLVTKPIRFLTREIPNGRFSSLSRTHVRYSSCCNSFFQTRDLCLTPLNRWGAGPNPHSSIPKKRPLIHEKTTYNFLTLPHTQLTPYGTIIAEADTMWSTKSIQDRPNVQDKSNQPSIYLSIPHHTYTKSVLLGEFVIVQHPSTCHYRTQKTLLDQSWMELQISKFTSLFFCMVK